MSLETGTTEPTADAAATPSAETASAATTAPATTGTATGTTERTYTQADMDKAAAWYRKSLREAEERFAQQARPQTPQPDPAQQALRAQIEALVGPMVAPIKQQAVEVSLDRAVVALGKRIPEFTDEKKVNAIFQTVVDMGLDRAAHLSVDQMLELGYRYWKHDELAKLAAQQPDIEAIKKQAADEAIKSYTTKKVETASKTPKPEGAGGTGAVTGKPKTLKRDEFSAALEAALARAE